MSKLTIKFDSRDEAIQSLCMKVFGAVPAYPESKDTSLAEKIATALLTPNGSKECHRMQLMERIDDGFERNMGGRNKQSMIDTISAVLADHELLNS